MPLIPLPKSLRRLEFIGILLHRTIIKKYSFCFIPDLPGDGNLSGRLSHGLKLPANVRYTGILSRFTNYTPGLKGNPVTFPHNTVILSGPEPQREILKQKLTEILKEREPITVMLEGKPGNASIVSQSGNIIFYNHLPSPEMKEMIYGSESIISRSGYTTIMDLVSLNCSALLIPTPGQTEQEYLAEYLSGKGWFTAISQRELNSESEFGFIKAIQAGEIVDQSKFLLAKVLEELLENNHKKN